MVPEAEAKAEDRIIRPPPCQFGHRNEVETSLVDLRYLRTG